MNPSEIVYGRRTQSAMAAWMAMAFGMYGPFLMDKMPAPKEKRKCRLPTCNILTDHNGGYCCGDHCKQHRRMKT